MELIWAPWRVEYIRMEKPDGCILCQKPLEDEDESNVIVYRGQTNFVIINRYPYNPGHLMVAPYRHIATPEDFTDEELDEHYRLVRRCLQVLRELFEPSGFNLGMNLGKVSGAGVDQHIHIHVVPRWQGDTNFMPVIAGTKVISEALADTYRKLKNGFATG